MKTNHLTQHRKGAVALAMSAFLLMFMVMGCDQAPGLRGPDEDEVQLTIDDRNDGAGKVFEASFRGMISGELIADDEGTFEGPEFPDFDLEFRAEWKGYRIFKGAEGWVYVHVAANPSPENNEGKVAEGTWTIMSGTGKYAGIEGTGKYVAKRDFNGGVKENFCGCCNGIFNH